MGLASKVGTFHATNEKGRSNVGIRLVPWEVDKVCIKVPFTYGALLCDFGIPNFSAPSCASVLLHSHHSSYSNNKYNINAKKINKIWIKLTIQKGVWSGLWFMFWCVWVDVDFKCGQERIEASYGVDLIIFDWMDLQHY